MPFERVSRAPVSDQVFVQLRDAILAGRLTPGDALPAERELAESFGVNRHAVREAVKRLQQSRLVRVSQGEPTRVLDWRRTAGFDLTIALVEGDALGAPTLTRDMLEMRATLGADAARLCAERATETELEAVAAASETYASTGPDLEALRAAELELWRAIVLGSGNVAYLLTFNSLVSHTLAVSPVPSAQRASELLDVSQHQRLVRHIAARNPAAAHRCALALLTQELTAVEDLVGREARR